MIQIIRGQAGENKKGDIVSLSKAVEERLINLGMAREMSESDISTGKEAFLDESELKKIRSKKEMMKYAQAIGCELDENATLKDMLAAVLNFQEEKEELPPEQEDSDPVPEMEQDENFGGPDVV